MRENVNIGEKVTLEVLKYPSRDLRKVSVVSPLILLSHDEIGGQNFLPEDPECVLERPKQFLWTQ